MYSDHPKASANSATSPGATTPLISKKEFARRLGFHPESISRRARQDPHFPQPIYISVNRCAFVEAEVCAWISARVAERDDILSKAASDE